MLAVALCARPELTFLFPPSPRVSQSTRCNHATYSLHMLQFVHGKLPYRLLLPSVRAVAVTNEILPDALLGISLLSGSRTAGGSRFQHACRYLVP